MPAEFDLESALAEIHTFAELEGRTHTQHAADIAKRLIEMARALNDNTTAHLITDHDIRDAEELVEGKWPGLEILVGDPMEYHMHLRDKRLQQKE